MREFDVAVVGGGPAGAATALLLARQGVLVALYEHSAYEALRLGETLAPSVTPLLRGLGVWDDFAGLGSLPCHEISSAWGTSDVATRSLIADPHGNGWHVDRPRFDTMLLAAAEKAGATVFREHVHAVRPMEQAFLVSAAAPIRATTVVDATGRSARVSRWLGARRVQQDRLVCAARVFAEQERLPTGDTIIEATEHGWWYACPLPDGRRVVACFTDADIAASLGLRHIENWSALLRRTNHVRHHVAGGVPHAHRVVTVASHLLQPCAGPGWLAVGDAALAVDPLSAEGVTFALRSANAAADALLHHEPTRYATLVNEVAKGYARDHAMVYGWERRFPTKPFWRSRVRDRPHTSNRAADMRT